MRVHAAPMINVNSQSMGVEAGGLVLVVSLPF